MEKLETVLKQRENEPAPPPTICKRCGGKSEPKFITILGWRRQEHCESCSKIVAEERERETADRERKEKIVRLFETSGMRGIMRDMTFDSFNQQRRGKIYEAAKRYAEDFTPQTNTGLILFGKAGAGKTHLAVAIARYVIEQKQIAARVARTVELLADIRQTFSEHDGYRAESEIELIRKFTSVSLLVLDDLGAEKISDWVKEVFYRIIDERWLEQRPVIVTSNLNIKELEEKIGDRVVSRIAGMCIPIEIQNQDYRIENAPRFGEIRRANSSNS